MKDDLTKYEALRDRGVGPRDVYLVAKADGYDPIRLLRLLRQVFSLSLVQAKEARVTAEGWASSLEEYQERLIPALEQAAQTEQIASTNGATSGSKDRSSAAH